MWDQTVCSQEPACIVSRVLLDNPMDCSPPGSSVHGFPRQEYWSGLPFPPPGDLLNPGMDCISGSSLALAGGFFTTEPPRKHLNINNDA